MATWDDVQRDFKERLDSIESTMGSLITEYRGDLENAIKEAKENDLLSMMASIRTRLDQIEKKLEDKDVIKEEASIGRSGR